MTGYRAWVQTDHYRVISNTVKFKSFGSRRPAIYDFYPKTGFDGDLLTIVGNSFSHYPNFNDVYINNLPADLVYSSADSLVCRLPAQQAIGDVPVTIKLLSWEVEAKQTFHITGPEIESIEPLEGQSGEVIRIRGKHLIKNGEDVDLKFGEHYSRVISKSDTLVEVLVPSINNYYFGDGRISLEFSNGEKKLVYENDFIIKHNWRYATAPPFSGPAAYQAFSYNNKAYVLDYGSLKLFEYDPIVNLWQEQAPFPSSTGDACYYMVVGDQVLKMGGQQNHSLLNDCWAYDFISQNWSQRADLPFHFSKATHFEFDGRYYFITNQKQVWEYDVATENFLRRNDFPVTFGAGFASAFQHDGQIYVVTNWKTWLYHPVDDSWSDFGDNPFRNIQNGQPNKGLMCNNTAYVMKGGSRFYKYYFSLNQWIKISSYPIAGGEQAYQSYFTLANKIYVLTTDAGPYGQAPLLFEYSENAEKR